MEVAWTSADCDDRLTVRQADGQAWPTRSSVEVLINLGALEEPKLFTVFVLDYDADIIVQASLGYAFTASPLYTRTHKNASA